LTEAIKEQKELLGELSDSGQVVGLGAQAKVGLEESDRLQLAMDLAMGYEPEESEKSRYQAVKPFRGLREAFRAFHRYPIEDDGRLTEMQTRAIMEAACNVAQEGVDVHPEIMIPLTSDVNELRIEREKLEKVAKDVMAEKGIKVDCKIGTMIEIPRAAITADKVAEYADFFSFGTNDLTQMTYGISRDDAEGKFLLDYVDRGILPNNPFEVLDRDGVGVLMKMCVEKGRATKPGLEIGICGEHGGEPSSVEFCHIIGLNYVSCSPFRVPIARLAAAQAALQHEYGRK